MRRIGVVLVVAAAVLALGVGAATSRTSRAPVQLGIYGDAARFAAQTGQQSTTKMLFLGWGQGATFGSRFPVLFSTMLAKPMVALMDRFRGGGAITPRQVATGTGDAYLVELNHAIHDWGKPIFVRPFPEMNGHWNSYCAYNTNGSARGPSNTTAMFRAAFARVYELMHGGPRVNAVLRALGQPLPKGALFENKNVEVIWNPQGTGSPDIPGNSAAAYYPGDSYVDMVGDDLYDIRYRPDWADAEKLYSAHPSKRFAFPEWAPWGIDDPGFVEHMATFVKTHSRVVLISYFAGQHPGSVWDLATKSKSRAAYRKLIVPLAR
jgi:hypothetical protein